MKTAIYLGVLLGLFGCLTPEGEKGIVTLNGSISVYDESNVFLDTELKGFEIEVVGTDKKATTNITGSFSFADMSSGSYMIRISGNSFPTHATPLIITQDARGTLSYNQLFTKRVSTTQIDSITFRTDYGSFPQNNSNIYYSVNLGPSDRKATNRGMILLIDTTSEVGLERFVVAKDQVGAINGNISGSIKNADFNFDFNTIDTLYIAVYGITSLSSARNGYFTNEVYLEPETKKLKFPFVNTASKKMIKLPLVKG